MSSSLPLVWGPPPPPPPPPILLPLLLPEFSPLPPSGAPAEPLPADLRSPSRLPVPLPPPPPSPPPWDVSPLPSPSALPVPCASRSFATRSCSFFSVLSKSPSESSRLLSADCRRSSEVCAPPAAPPGPSGVALPALPSLPQNRFSNRQRHSRHLWNRPSSRLWNRPCRRLTLRASLASKTRKDHCRRQARLAYRSIRQAFRACRCCLPAFRWNCRRRTRRHWSRQTGWAYRHCYRHRRGSAYRHHPMGWACRRCCHHHRWSMRNPQALPMPGRPR